MISICIATFNGEHYIKDQLLSILPQLTVHDEVIISDDNSSDRTIKIIEEFNDPRIKIYYNNPLKKGYSNNFENALSKSNQQFIFLCDQDDIWFDNKIQIYKSKLLEYDFVFSDAQFVDSKLIDKNITFFDQRGKGDSFISNLIKQKTLGCCIAFNRDVLKKSIPFPQNSRYCTHDLWLTLVGTFYFKTLMINEPLILYRRHKKNVSNGGIKSTSSFLFKISFRFYALFYILKIFKK